MVWLFVSILLMLSPFAKTNIWLNTPNEEQKLVRITIMMGLGKGVRVRDLRTRTPIVANKMAKTSRFVSSTRRMHNRRKKKKNLLILLDRIHKVRGSAAHIYLVRTASGYVEAIILNWTAASEHCCGGWRVRYARCHVIGSLAVTRDCTFR